MTWLVVDTAEACMIVPLSDAAVPSRKSGGLECLTRWYADDVAMHMHGPSSSRRNHFLPTPRDVGQMLLPLETPPTPSLF